MTSYECSPEVMKKYAVGETLGQYISGGTVTHERVIEMVRVDFLGIGVKLGERLSSNQIFVINLKSFIIFKLNTTVPPILYLYVVLNI